MYVILYSYFLLDVYVLKLLLTARSDRYKKIESHSLGLGYSNDPKFSDRQVWANSVDPDETVWSGSTLFAIPSASLDA